MLFKSVFLCCSSRISQQKWGQNWLLCLGELFVSYVTVTLCIWMEQELQWPELKKFLISFSPSLCKMQCMMLKIIANKEDTKTNRRFSVDHFPRETRNQTSASCVETKNKRICFMSKFMMNINCKLHSSISGKILLWHMYGSRYLERGKKRHFLFVRSVIQALLETCTSISSGVLQQMLLPNECCTCHRN